MRKAIFAAAWLVASLMPAEMTSAQAGDPEVISVELSNFKFSPSELTLQHGHVYRLHLVNAAAGGHDFSAPEFFAASAIDAADKGHIVDGKVKLDGKQTIDITLAPGKPGTYKVLCSHFMHSGMGMKGQITVQ